MASSNWFVEKILPGLMIFMTISICTAAVGIWQKVDDLAHQMSQVDRRVRVLEAKIEQTTTRAEMLETLKRVEQQLQIVLLQNGVKQKIELK